MMCFQDGARHDRQGNRRSSKKRASKAAINCETDFVWFAVKLRRGIVSDEDCRRLQRRRRPVGDDRWLEGHYSLFDYPDRHGGAVTL